ncbi:uncharacterized protein LOC133740956 isoform X1 [Rosa rugosa]|uniref:uncharacterized protein LOC133712591 isoform X1 n=2 Tax=Rosa rugosa TaxID=74645 RepID=UPI002B403618|nr:uncharacterized protein LOC133712591 isoform X1 [Rosa rugosa]XP_062024875.1 uncharacterized protein LOC133740956 isoform X1 [Rosa rugosa]
MSFVVDQLGNIFSLGAGIYHSSSMKPKVFGMTASLYFEKVSHPQWTVKIKYLNLKAFDSQQVENKKDAPPNRKERFKITHLKKGSKTEYIDEASTQAVLIFEQKEAEKANQNIEITSKVVEDIYADVFGVERRNRVRGMGTGYKWADVPFIHTENKGISKEVEELRAAVEEQKSVSARALMEVERLRIESARERNEVAEREKQREAELDKIRADQLQMMENMKKMQDLMEMPRT